MTPDFIYVAVPVAFEGGVIQAAVVVRGEDADEAPVLVDDAEAKPGLTIDFTLSPKTLTQRLDCVGAEAACDLRPGWLVFGGEGHAENEADKVNVADICVDCAGCRVRELDEAPVEGGAGVVHVCHGGLHEALAVSRVQHEEAEVPLAEVDPPRRERDGNLEAERFALAREGDGEVVVDLDGLSGTVRAGVDEAPVGGNEDDGTLGVETLDVGVDWASVEVVDNFQREGLNSFGLETGEVAVVRAIERVVLCDRNLCSSRSSNREAFVGERGTLVCERHGQASQEGEDEFEIHHV